MKRDVSRQRGRAQVAALVSRCYPVNAQAPVMQHGEARRSGRRRRGVVAGDDFTSIFLPRRHGRCDVTGGVAGKQHDVAR